MKKYLFRLIDEDIKLCKKRMDYLINWKKQGGNTDSYYTRKIKADENKIELAEKTKQIIESI